MNRFEDENDAAAGLRHNRGPWLMGSMREILRRNLAGKSEERGRCSRHPQILPF
jgi:hypothetical protein